jgi:hypothetical protein
MNCKDVQELLPLYVGRDLEERRAQMVTAHVRSCAACAGLADEYRETRQLLQQFAPPPVSDAVYAGIRRRVLREIGREANPRTLPNFVASLFRPRLPWAVATALLLAVSVFALYSIANRKTDPKDRQQLADSRGKAVGPASSSIKESEGVTPASTVKNVGPVQGLADSTHQSQRRKSSGTAADRTRSGALNTPDAPTMSAQNLPDGSSRFEPETVPAGDSATSDKTLRVEIQTKDPNIRIIWFTHQPIKQDSPNKFSKGT